MPRPGTRTQVPKSTISPFIYIVIHWQTVSLYHNTSVWLDTLDAWSWDGKPPNFTLDLVSYRSAIPFFYYWNRLSISTPFSGSNNRMITSNAFYGKKKRHHVATSKDQLPQQRRKKICDTNTGKLRSYVLASLCKDIFTTVHSLSHPGANVSVCLLTYRFVWLCIKADVRAWTKTCFKCQKAKVGRHTPAPVGEFPAPDERVKHILIDITEPLSTCEGQSYLLT